MAIDTALPLKDIFVDPISLEEIRDPVIDRCGHTFSRAQIIQWIREKRTCPFSREALQVDDLIPNRIVKEALAIINRNGWLSQRIEGLPIGGEERGIVERAAKRLQPPKRLAKAVGDYVERAINCDYTEYTVHCDYRG